MKSSMLHPKRTDFDNNSHIYASQPDEQCHWLGMTNKKTILYLVRVFYGANAIDKMLGSSSTDW